MRSNSYMSRAEKVEFSKSLAEHYTVFEKFWDVGEVLWDDSLKIPTAAIRFDAKAGNAIQFHINEKWWRTLTDVQQRWVICHEMLHVIFYHGYRMVEVPRYLHRYLNIALDIVVNETLVRSYGFKYSDVDDMLSHMPTLNPETGVEETPPSCFVHTVFKHMDPLPPKNRDYAYYMNLLLQNTKQYGGESSMDDHDMLESFLDDDGSGNGWESELGRALNKAEKNELKKITKEQLNDMARESYSKMAGKEPGNFEYTVQGTRAWSKKPWESVIKVWKMKAKGDGEDLQWRKKDRRYTTIQREGLYLPSDDEDSMKTEKRIEVWVFQDTSGSCAGFVDRFFAAAESLNACPQFDVRLFCFDTRVYETDFISKKLYGFGGTTFSCIEQDIQARITKEGIKYPDAVFIITDGYGDRVNPERPDNWHVFLSTGDRSCFPDKVRSFNLSEFE